MEILVVDDDLIDRTHIKRTLRRSDAGCIVTEVEDVNSALLLLKEKRFDAILLDFNMPQRNGLSLLHEIKNESVENGSAIIMMSTSEEEELAMQCINEGAQDFIAKSDITGYRLRRAILGARARYEMEQKLKDSYKKVKQLAEQDDLTKLANRYLFDETLKQTINRNNRQQYKVALILFDLDNFKYVNDTHGHDVGDVLLQKVVNRINTCLRDTELFSRLGGDEFAIILSHLQRVDEAEKVSLRILRVLEKPFEINNACIDMSASIGISIYPDSSKNATEMFKRADIAMYKAKQLGRNQISFFEEEMQRLFLKRYRIENELKSFKKNNQLELYFQPIFDGKKLNACGFEALLRWHSSSGSIPPDEFIPIAEDCKIINPIGRWVIEQAFNQLMIWRKQHKLDLKMSINLSPIQLHDDGLLSHIQSNLKTFDLPANSVEFELTETALLDITEQTLQTIRKISDLGCKIALDDFGTGFSSLSHLHHFPINTVKIDKSLMPNNNKDDNHKLISGLVAMLQYLDLEIVAEGLESESHLELCKKLHIHRFQGFFLAKPMDVTNINNNFNTLTKSK